MGNRINSKLIINFILEFSETTDVSTECLLSEINPLFIYFCENKLINLYKFEDIFKKDYIIYETISTDNKTDETELINHIKSLNFLLYKNLLTNLVTVYYQNNKDLVSNSNKCNNNEFKNFVLYLIFSFSKLLYTYLKLHTTLDDLNYFNITTKEMLDYINILNKDISNSKLTDNDTNTLIIKNLFPYNLIHFTVNELSILDNCILENFINNYEIINNILYNNFKSFYYDKIYCLSSIFVWFFNTNNFNKDRTICEYLEINKLLVSMFNQASLSTVLKGSISSVFYYYKDSSNLISYTLNYPILQKVLYLRLLIVNLLTLDSNIKLFSSNQCMNESNNVSNLVDIDNNNNNEFNCSLSKFLESIENNSKLLIKLTNIQNKLNLNIIDLIKISNENIYNSILNHTYYHSKDIKGILNYIVQYKSNKLKNNNINCSAQEDVLLLNNLLLLVSSFNINFIEQCLLDKSIYLKLINYFNDYIKKLSVFEIEENNKKQLNIDFYFILILDKIIQTTNFFIHVKNEIKSTNNKYDLFIVNIIKVCCLIIANISNDSKNNIGKDNKNIDNCVQTTLNSIFLLVLLITINKFLLYTFKNDNNNFKNKYNNQVSDNLIILFNNVININFELLNSNIKYYFICIKAYLYIVIHNYISGLIDKDNFIYNIVLETYKANNINSKNKTIINNINDVLINNNKYKEIKNVCDIIIKRIEVENISIMYSKKQEVMIEKKNIYIYNCLLFLDYEINQRSY